jgi:all-trans-retinol dehydrogenase (NAD+)
MLFIIIFWYLVYLILLFVYDKLRFKDVSPSKTVLITGAAQGLGKDLAFRYASKGCKVVIWDVCEGLFEDLRNEIEMKGFQVFLIKCDITSYQEIKEALRKTLEIVGKVDILINNAGISSNFLIENMPTDRLSKTLSVNLLGHAMVTKEMLEICEQFVFICSIVSKNAYEKASDYCASKAAGDMFFKSLRLELKRKRSAKKVTIVYPYHIKTKMFEGFHVKNVPIIKSLEISEAVEGIYKGICLGKEEVFLPGYVWIPAYFLELLPSKLRDALTLFLSDGAFENVKCR